MNYRHAFHAGNFADLVKHAALMRVLAGLTGEQEARVGREPAYPRQHGVAECGAADFEIAVLVKGRAGWRQQHHGLLQRRGETLADRLSRQRLLSPPEPLDRVMSDLPDRAPVRFQWRGKPYQTRMKALCEGLGELGIWTRLHYVYPYPHVDDIIPLMAEGRLLPYLDRFAPDTIVTFGPEGMTGHTDNSITIDAGLDVGDLRDAGHFSRAVAHAGLLHDDLDRVGDLRPQRPHDRLIARRLQHVVIDPVVA